MLVQRLDFGPASARRCASRSSAGTATAIPTHAKGEAIPLRDARRAPQPRHGGDRPPLLAGARARRRPRSPRPHLRPGARRPVRRAWPRLVRAARRDRAVGRRARPRARAAPHARRRRARRRAHRRRRLHRPQVAVHGRAQPALRGPRRRRRAGARARRGGTSRRCAARRSCTTSAPPSVPNSIWDKPGPLTRTEFDRVELHPMLTEQMLRRSPALAVLNPVASRAPREVRRVRLPQARAGRRRRSRSVRAGGDGDLRRADHRARGPSAVLARGRRRRASPARVGGRARASRQPRGARRRRTRRAASARRANGRRTRAGSPGARSTCCASPPSGLTTREIADRLYISPKTADHHIQHIYGKIGVDARRRRALGDAARRRPVILR